MPPVLNAMKYLILLMLLPGFAFANDSHCYSIQNHDQKNFCLARAKQQTSYCYSIHESDTKNFCLAQINRQSSYCYSIRNNDNKNQCLAMTR